jgi:hypothetical protein
MIELVTMDREEVLQIEIEENLGIGEEGGTTFAAIMVMMTASLTKEDGEIKVKVTSEDQGPLKATTMIGVDHHYHKVKVVNSVHHRQTTTAGVPIMNLIVSFVDHHLAEKIDAK